MCRTATCGCGGRGPHGNVKLAIENPAQVTKQDRETVRVRSYTVPAGSRMEEAREMGAKLASLKGVVWVGVGLFLFGLATLFYPPLKLVVGSVTTSVAIVGGGVALMVLPSLVVGNELLILGGVAVAVGGWFLAHRHGQLRGMVEVSTKSADNGGSPTPTSG